MAAAGWDALDFSRSPMPGSRRPHAVTLENPETTLEDGVLRLAFALPSGAYATNVVREILKQSV
jgi:tRNA(Glu) U13 pseudouridine synthase TruD